MAKTKKTNPSKKKLPRIEARKAPAAKPAPPPPPAPGKRPTMEKPSKKSALRDSILARKAATKPIALSLDEVRAIAKTVSAKAESTLRATKSAAKPSAAQLAIFRLGKPRQEQGAKFRPRRADAFDRSHQKRRQGMLRYIRPLLQFG